ncbi:MAG: STAS/SEC14 domain-containing protein [Alcanivoracaceae bacterium]|nr:STAS/SEC14 domain-containing protein [Alcanivoracaceae bacterium]
MLIENGLTIGVSRVATQYFLLLKAVGKLTHDDYRIISPMLESAIKCIDQPRINLLIDASEFEGWELRAAWNDFKLSLKHGKKFYRIAIISNKKWQKYATKIGSWFIAGEIRRFDDLSTAVEWVQHS